MLRRSLFPLSLLAFVALGASHALPPAVAGGGEGEPAPKVVTLAADRILLADALKELSRQTGIPIDNRSREKPALHLELKQVPFWQALDTIARDSRTQVSPYGRLSLIDGPSPDPATISYDGLFRTSARKLVSVRDLAAGAHYYVASLEVAWEPDFAPFLLETRPRSIVLHDDAGHDVPVPDNGSEQSPVAGRTTQEIEIRLPALDRSIKKIGLLKGEMSAIGPTRMLTFTFDGLQAGQEKKQDGVAVTLVRLVQREKVWTVELALEYPPGGPKLDSYQSWIVNNTAHLKNRSGQRLVSTSYASEAMTSNRAVVSYHFEDDPGRAPLLRGSKPEDWQLVYTTPAWIVEIPIHFEFKDLALP